MGSGLYLACCVAMGDSFGLPGFQFASEWEQGPYLTGGPARSKVQKFFAVDI